MKDQDDSAPDMSGTALAQGDLAVNLFIVLLVVLSVLTVAKVSSSSDGYLTPYQRGETGPTVSAPVLGWQPVLPAYPKLVLRGGQVHLLDTRALALAFAAGTQADLGPDAIDSSKMRGGDLDPVAHQVFLYLNSETGFPEALSRASVAVSALGEPEGDSFFATLGDVPKVDIFAFPEGTGQMTPLVEAVHTRKIATRLLMMRQNGVFGFVQSGGDFGLERTFK